MSLVEVLVAFSVLIIVAVPLTTLFTASSKFARVNRNRLLAESLAQDKMETIRNLNYDNVGTDTGWPRGIISASVNGIEKGGVTFDERVDIRYVDDPYDGNIYGTVPGKGVDLYSNDYKKVQIRIYKDDNLLTELSSNVSPSGQETAVGTGVLEISALDGNGNAASDAQVEINDPGKSISIVTTTNIEGKVLVPALPPDTEAYGIKVSKGSLYSVDQTYAVTLENPNPVKKPLSVNVGKLTQSSFQIDQLSNVSLKLTLASDPNESPILNPVNLKVTGNKTIGSDGAGLPIYKYQATALVENGQINLPNLEWDTYTFELTGGSEAAWQIVESVPPLPLVLNPGVNVNLVIKLQNL